jgi:hypothetical protein
MPFRPEVIFLNAQPHNSRRSSFSGSPPYPWFCESVREWEAYIVYNVV